MDRDLPRPSSELFALSFSIISVSATEAAKANYFRDKVEVKSKLILRGD